MLAQCDADPSLCGLAAWAVKEAAWKALRPPPQTCPSEIRLHALCIPEGRAEAEGSDRLTRGDATPTLRVRFRQIAGPDGAYVFALAQASTEAKDIDHGWP